MVYGTSILVQEQKPVPALQVNDDNDVFGFASGETLKELCEGCLEAVLLVDL
jgi:hypothetical protein